MNQLLAGLLESVEGLLNTLKQRSFVEQKERKMYQLLMDAKYELLRSKMEQFQAEVQIELTAMDIRVEKIEENSSSRVKFTLEAARISEEKGQKRSGVRIVRQGWWTKLHGEVDEARPSFVR